MTWRSPSQLLHEHLGTPPSDKCALREAPFVCWFCGGASVGRGCLVSQWDGAVSVVPDRIKAPTSPLLCEACVYFASRLSPVPGRLPKEGQTQGGNWRNYSHTYEDTPAGVVYQNFSKGEKPGLLAWLRKVKKGLWWCAIAESGQKHVLPWAHLNTGHGQGKVLFEETVVRLPDVVGWQLVDDMRDVLTKGATKEEVARGVYSPYTWQKIPYVLQAFERRYPHRRDSPFFALCVFLAQRDEVAVQARLEAEKQQKEEEKKKPKRGRTTKDTSRKSHDRLLGGSAEALPEARGEPSHGSRPNTLADEAGLKPDPRSQGMGEPPPAVATNTLPRQMGLLLPDSASPGDRRDEPSQGVAEAAQDQRGVLDSGDAAARRRSSRAVARKTKGRGGDTE